jgi:phosphopantothenate synthetase
VQEGTTNLLKSSGVDVDTISREATAATKTVTDVSSKATPTVTKVIDFLSSSSPETLGKIVIVLVAVYYLTPFALKTAVSSLRGYAGVRTTC